MRNAIVMTGFGVLLAAGVSLAAPRNDEALATSPAAVIYDAESAFEYFKSLAGEWHSAATEAHHGSTSPGTRFEVKAHGSAVVQTVYEGQPNEMESIFHMDGGELLLTHYCALQNAPVLRFAASDEPGRIDFVFHGGTNFDPAIDAHFHEGTFVVKDKDTVESSYVVFANGEATPEGRSVLKRMPRSTSN